MLMKAQSGTLTGVPLFFAATVGCAPYRTRVRHAGSAGGIRDSAGCGLAY